MFRYLWVILLPTPLICLSKHSHPQDVWINTKFPWSRSTPCAQQTILKFDDIPQWDSSRDRWYQNCCYQESSWNWECSQKSSIPFKSTMLSFLPPRRNGEGGNWGPNSLPSNGRYYPNWSYGRHNSHHGAPSGGDFFIKLWNALAQICKRRW